MAASSFPEAAVWELSPAVKPRRRRWAVPRPEDDSDEEPAVLVLSHFSRPPYLSFGTLRVGASRTRLLGIDNPNAEHAEVVVDRFPASARGFSLERRRFAVEVRGGGKLRGARGGSEPCSRAAAGGGGRASLPRSLLRSARGAPARCGVMLPREELLF